MQIVIASLSRISQRALVSLILISAEARGSLLSWVMCNLDRDLNEPFLVSEIWKERIDAVNYCYLYSPSWTIAWLQSFLFESLTEENAGKICIQHLTPKTWTSHDKTDLQERKMCPYLAKIWTLSVCASQFTIYTVCFTRGIIIQRLEFSQLSPKFPEKRGVVAILCSELSVTGDQWEVTIQPYGQSEEATALHDWLNSSVEWYALEAKPGNAFSRALPLSL